MPPKLPENPYHELAWIAPGSRRSARAAGSGRSRIIDGLGGLKLGKGCNVSSGAHVLSHSTARRCVSEKMLDVIDYRPTEIGDHVFIGANAVVLMGCKVGHLFDRGRRCRVARGHGGAALFARGRRAGAGRAFH